MTNLKPSFPGENQHKFATKNPPHFHSHKFQNFIIKKFLDRFGVTNSENALPSVHLSA